MYSPTGSATVVHDKPPIDTAAIILVDGVQVQPLAADRRARHIAVGGVYDGSTPWIQVYEMPP